MYVYQATSSKFLSVKQASVAVSEDFLVLVLSYHQKILDINSKYGSLYFLLRKTHSVSCNRLFCVYGVIYVTVIMRISHYA